MNLFFSTEGRTKLKEGIDKISNAVKVTLGAKGRNVIIRIPNSYPHVTKDGVTVARSIFLNDDVEDMGALLVKQAAVKTVADAGDGTTTATVLLQAIVSNAETHLSQGINPMHLKAGVEAATKKVIDFIKKKAMPLDDLSVIKHIATISANNDSSIGYLLHEAFTKVGKDGLITIEESTSHETTLSVAEGLVVERGYISHQFITNPAKMKAELLNPKVLIVEKTIVFAKDLMNILNACAVNKNPLLIIADDVQGEALSFLAVNKQKGALSVNVIKSPSFGEERSLLLKDIALMTGAFIISDDNGLSLEEAEYRHLGSADKIISDKASTVIINGGGDPEKVTHVIQTLKEFIETKGHKDYDLNVAKGRLAKLKNGVAIIRVGGVTETELKERKDRMDDALCATKSAIEEGYVAGGGVTFFQASYDLEDIKTDNEEFNLGVDIIKESIKSPFNQIMSNGGLKVGTYIPLTKGNEGYNVKTDKVENFIESGVIDPVKVLRVSLENASSIGTMYLISECVVS